MAEIEVRVRPPHSLILVGDPHGRVPERIDGNLTRATSTCVAIGTLSDLDGETTVRVTDSLRSTAEGAQQLAFEGDVELASNVLRIGNVLGEVYLDWPVSADSVSLQVWVNHPSEPDEIWIVTR